MTQTKKPGTKFRFLLQLLSAAFFVGILGLTLNGNAHAIEIDPLEGYCNPSKSLYEEIQEAFEALDIRRTIVNLIQGATTDVPFHIIADGSPEDVLGCLGYIRNSAGGSAVNSLLGDVCGIDQCTPKSESYCRGIINTYEDAKPTGSGSLEVASSRTGGSLIGYANLMENTTYEPVPVNLAYFMNKQTEKIPVMGTALAQEVEYSGPFLGLTYDLWKVFRNAAFGAMAVVMIVVGIMIMTRKKLNPQTAVTVQYALPRTILALVLITFSYPIGAIIASFAWALRFSADNIIIQLAIDSAADGSLLLKAYEFAELGIVGNGIILVVLGIMPGAGTVGFVLLVLAFAITLIVWIMILFKMIMIYIKMITQIIAAPIIFTYSSIPGNEEHLTNWFKKMGVYTGSLLVMSAVVGIVRIAASAVIVNLLENIVTSSCTIDIASAQDAGIAGTVFIVGPLLVAFIYVYGFNQARKLPDKIEEAVFGKKR